MVKESTLAELRRLVLLLTARVEVLESGQRVDEWLIEVIDFDGQVLGSRVWRGVDPSKELPIGISIDVSNRLQSDAREAHALRITNRSLPVNAPLKDRRRLMPLRNPHTVYCKDTFHWTSA